MSDYIYKPATELAQLILSGQVTSVEIVQEHLDQIKKHNPSLNAVIIHMGNEALKTAAECDEETKKGISRGPLHGVPMTVKEQYWVKGTKSTLNFKKLKDWVAPEDAVIIERLKNAGAVILGKTNVPKNLLDYQVNGDIYPECKNPYNTDYTPGGSSGGSSAALASGMVPIELGGDFGGSIRIPSNFCGIYGMKPTENTVPGHGNVPKVKGAKDFIFHMAQAGPMARTPEDLELVWKVIRGPHRSDRNTPRIEWKNPEGKKLSDYRIAWVDSWPGYDTSDQNMTVIENFISQLNQNNCKTKNSAPTKNLHERSLSLDVRLFPQMIAQGLPWFIKPLMKMQLKNTLLKGLDKFKWELNKGFKHSLINYSETMGIRAGIVSEWEKYFEDFDILVCPMSYGPAFKRCKIGTSITYESKRLIYVNYVWPYVGCFNASGHPAINIPLGMGKEGLPVGVQIVGPYWSEPDLLHFAKLVSEFTPGFIKPEGY